MTAYGRASVAVPLGCFTVELYSVNRRHLEVNNCFPSEFLCYDADIKRWIASVVSRGFITAKFSAQYNQATPITIKPNLALARQLKGAWQQIADEMGLPFEKSFSLEILARNDQIITYETNPTVEIEFKAILKQAIDQALEKLVEMKVIEGAALSQDISGRLEQIKLAVDEIAVLAPQAAKRYHLELQNRIEALLPGKIENEERILRELCVYAEKVDVSEEIARLESHVKQFCDLLQAPPRSVGKTLEFLVQEMNREINTVGSKASELKISQLVIKVKSELERIREQIQNIE